MTTYENPELRRRLGAALRRLRLTAEMTGEQLGAAVGINQARVSRVENGDFKRLPLSTVDAWCEATGAPTSIRRDVLALAEQVLLGPTSWSEAGASGSTNLQPTSRDIEAKTGILSFYQPVSIPGLLQTPAYARRLLSSGPDGTPADIAQRVMDRVERQHILYDQDKQIRFVIPEAALLWPYGPPDDPAVMDEHREQLGRVLMALDRPNVQVGVLPLRPVAVWRLGGFVIYDEVQGGDSFVHLELLTRPFDLDKPADVDFFRRTFINLMDASVTGDEARRLIVAAMRALD
jgi:transcriptional regulator with XRE-family HTH domain